MTDATAVLTETDQNGLLTEQHETVKVPDQNPAMTEETESLTHPMELARLRVNQGLTVNMGDYNSARFDVSLEIPIEPDPDNLAAMYNFAKEWTEEKVNAWYAENAGR